MAKIKVACFFLGHGVVLCKWLILVITKQLHDPWLHCSETLPQMDGHLHDDYYSTRNIGINNTKINYINI